MLPGKAIFLSLETLSANNKDIQIYAENQAKHSTFSSLLVWKKCLHKICCGKNFFEYLKQLFDFIRFLLFSIFL